MEGEKGMVTFSGEDEYKLRNMDGRDETINVMIKFKKYMDKIIKLNRDLPHIENYSDNSKGNYKSYNEKTNKIEYADYDKLVEIYNGNLEETFELEREIENGFINTISDDDNNLIMADLLHKYKNTFLRIHKIVHIPQVINYLLSKKRYDVLKEQHGSIIILLHDAFLKLQGYVRTLEKPLSKTEIFGPTSNRRSSPKRTTVTRKPSGIKIGRPTITRKSSGKKKQPVKKDKSKFMSRIQKITGIKF